MTSDELIKDICAKEIQSGCYSHTINGIAIYNYVKRFLRKQKCREYGFISDYKTKRVDNKTRTITIMRSSCQLFSLLLFKKEIRNFIYAFPRVDKVNGIYLDKFTDPVIDNSIIKEQGYFIFEKGENYTHFTPRVHSNKVVYCDAIDFYSDVLAKISLRWFMNKHKSEFDGLWQSIDAAFPNVIYYKKITAHTILQSYILTKIYKFIFKRLSIVNLIAPGRGVFSSLIPAAKLAGVKVLEMQHGVTYGESVTYSGYRDPLFIPDFFLSFGENKPVDVYGISPEKIYNIGYAFIEYLNKCISASVEEKIANYDILVVSEPHITTTILSVVSQLAEQNPSIIFHFRPHPDEYLTDKQITIIGSTSNIVIDDNKQKILVVLNKYKFVIGENSTVLYEALSMGKKVGKLSMGGLRPRFLCKEDEDSFYIITNNEDFVCYLNSSKDIRLSKTIYSSFQSNIVNSLL